MSNFSKYVVFLLLCINLQSQNALAINDVEGLKEYTQNLTDKGLELLNNKSLSQSEKKNELKKLISGHLYFNWMAKYTLGKHRRVISKSKLSEFIEVYSNFILKVYIGLLIDYKNEKPILLGVRQIDDDLFLVKMELKAPGEDSIIMDYLIHKIENETSSPYRLGDIINEGISLLGSQQSEFNSIISSKGIDALIKDLRMRSN